MKITSMVYNFEYNSVCFIEREITGETERNYMTDTWRYPKSEIGRVIHKAPTQSSYLQIFTVDGNENDLRKELSKWFLEKHSKILNKELDVK